MRKNIIQSKTEPNKNDIWLSEEGLKKYGKNGWEPLGGGNSSNSGGSNSGGGGPVIIELSIGDEGIGTVSLSEEQINAAKNSNIKLKINEPDGIHYMILVPYFYGIREENITFYTRMMNGAGHISDSTFSIDVINKTIVGVN